MNASRLLEHFDRISEAPDAIPKLRRFVLDLAVRGKLVEQDPADEPATGFLEMVRADRCRLVLSGELKRNGSFEPVDPSEIPFSIPRGWKTARLGWLALKLGAGSTPLGGKSVYQSEGIPFLRSQNVHDDGLRLDDVALIPLSVHRRMSGTHVHPTDVLLNITGASIGRCALVPETIGAANVSQHVAIIRLVRPEIRSFIHLSLISPLFQALIDRVQVGVSREGLSMQGLKQFPMLVPPIAEQGRIVSKVDELMELCDRLEAANVEREGRRERLVSATLGRSGASLAEGAAERAVQFSPSWLDHVTTRSSHVTALRQAILDLAVRGRLVPQDPLDELAAALIARSRDEKGRPTGKASVGRTTSTTDGAPAEPFELPASWAWVRLGDLLLGDSQNGYSKKPDDDPEGVPILRISAGTVRRDGVVAEEEHKLIGGVTQDQLAQFALRPGDLLACRFNGNKSFVGRFSLYLGYSGISPIYPDKLIRLRLLSEFFLPALVRHFAESTPIRSVIEQYCATTVGNWGISATNLKEIAIPVPPRAEQQRIVAKVAELMTVCDGLDLQLAVSKDTSRKLIDSLVYEAL